MFDDKKILDKAQRHRELSREHQLRKRLDYNTCMEKYQMSKKKTSITITMTMDKETKDYLDQLMNQINNRCEIILGHVANINTILNTNKRKVK